MKVVDDPSVSGRNGEMNSLLAALSGLLKGDATRSPAVALVGCVGQGRRRLQRGRRAERRRWPTS